MFHRSRPFVAQSLGGRSIGIEGRGAGSMRGHQGRTENTMALFDTQALNPGVTRGEVLAWACYDFANSGYTTVVLTAVFSAYFVGTVAADVAHPTTVWT